jgi:hypothetical protein
MSVSTIAFHNLYEELNRNNRLFDEPNAPIGDDLLLPFSELRNKAAEQGITVATTAALDPDRIDAYVFIDMPSKDNKVFRSAFESGKPLYLLVLESPLACPQSHETSNHKWFKSIFTYDDSVVGQNRCIKLNYAFNLPGSVPRDLARKKKLCLTIAGNKRSTHPQELYSERLAAIHWFEQNHPSDLDLYGIGWDDGVIGSFLPRVITNRCSCLKKLGKSEFPLWRGTVERKRDVMGLYRFAFCYENICDVPGYITEKLFDAFFAGTVPVYRGAGNITDHVPPECFIDLRNFADYASLYSYIEGMTDGRYLEYINAIENFLRSDRAKPFSCECFADTLLTEIANGQKTASDHCRPHLQRGKDNCPLHREHTAGVKVRGRVAGL